MEKLNEAFLSIYCFARLEESKTSLLQAVDDYRNLTAEAPANAANAVKNTRKLDGFIQHFEADLVYILQRIQDEPILDEATREDFFNKMITNAANIFKNNNIHGLNILGDKLPDNIMPSYYGTYLKQLAMAYAEKGIVPSFTQK